MPKNIIKMSKKWVEKFVRYAFLYNYTTSKSYLPSILKQNIDLKSIFAPNDRSNRICYQSYVRRRTLQSSSKFPMNSYLMVNLLDLCKNGVLVIFLVINIEWPRFGPLVTYELKATLYGLLWVYNYFSKSKF